MTPAVATGEIYREFAINGWNRIAIGFRATRSAPSGPSAG